MKARSDGPVAREDDQEDILATALILSQSYGSDLSGMSAAAWVEEAISFRRMVKAAGDVVYELPFVTEPDDE